MGLTQVDGNVMRIAYFIVCLLVLGVATYTDIRKNKIYNEIFYPVLALSLTVPFVVGFWPFMLRVGMVMLVFFMYEGFIKAGDAKLLMTLIMLGSPLRAALTMVFAIIAELVYSFIMDPEVTKASVQTGLIALVTKTVKDVKGKGPTILFAPFMAVGFILATIICGI